jgi:hypothetical protein
MWYGGARRLPSWSCPLPRADAPARVIVCGCLWTGDLISPLPGAACSPYWPRGRPSAARDAALASGLRPVQTIVENQSVRCAWRPRGRLSSIRSGRWAPGRTRGDTVHTTAIRGNRRPYSGVGTTCHAEERGISASGSAPDAAASARREIPHVVLEGHNVSTVRKARAAPAATAARSAPSCHRRFRAGPSLSAPAARGIGGRSCPTSNCARRNHADRAAMAEVSC